MQFTSAEPPAGISPTGSQIDVQVESGKMRFNSGVQSELPSLKMSQWPTKPGVPVGISEIDSACVFDIPVKVKTGFASYPTTNTPSHEMR